MKVDPIVPEEVWASLDKEERKFASLHYAKGNRWEQALAKRYTPEQRAAMLDKIERMKAGLPQPPEVA